MTTYSITIKTSGAVMGTYDGETAIHALAAMHRDAGYDRATVDEDGDLVNDSSAVDASGAWICAQPEDCIIEEVQPVSFEG